MYCIMETLAVVSSINHVMIFLYSSSLCNIDFYGIHQHFIVGLFLTLFIFNVALFVMSPIFQMQHYCGVSYSFPHWILLIFLLLLLILGSGFPCAVEYMCVCVFDEEKGKGQQTMGCIGFSSYAFVYLNIFYRMQEF